MKGRLVECLETVLNKAQEPPKSKKVQHSNAKNAILFETISLIIHYDRCLLGAAGDLDSCILGDWVWELRLLGGRAMSCTLLAHQIGAGPLLESRIPDSLHLGSAAQMSGSPGAVVTRRRARVKSRILRVLEEALLTAPFSGSCWQ